ncbi:N-acetylglucosamine-6-phosphate deacetylase [Paenibacillus sp. CF384]|uniref:N-acetylglucosamine-6-phosphate deacetylase n=1 Tax=Paenibacillus sp. CF384 TaxID=1884382 RepID=UPI00089B7579|nr:N-acetylglucosamine-6-phosphate deacetylase [Paenibacillus sp. CF384]SDW17126.1 N-acetylglucosamine 6-phosphate deacetylase [Paenibacillus sp. CF384]
MAAQALCVVGATVYTPNGIVEQGRLIVDEHGKIAAIGGSELQVESQVVIQDASGMLLIPGFVDVHIHGGNGCSVMTGEYEQLDGISRFHAAHGTTSFLATTTTAPLERIELALRNIAAAIREGVSGAELIGIHLEGPYIDEKRRGAQSKADIREPNGLEIERLIEAADHRIKLVTLAPEVNGGLEAVRQLASLGITVSAGHSNATYEQVGEAVSSGLSHTTHHFNGMSPLHHREPGLAGAGLMLAELTTELICDGIHVHPAVVKLLFDTKGPDQVCMITDAVSCAGLADGDYGEVTMRGGQILLKDGSSLAGSSLTMIHALRNAIRFTGYPLEKLLPSMTAVPARQAGVVASKGSLEQGKDADFLLLDQNLDIVATYVRGKAVYRRETDD